MTLCLLASYPRSGNTWLRTLLTVCENPEATLALDALTGTSIMVDPQTLSAELGIDPREITLEALDEARASWMRLQNAGSASQPPRFLKTHCINRALPSGRRFADASCGQAIYLVRHPLDVAVSFASFMNQSVEETVEAMLRPHALLSRPGTRRPSRLAEYVSSWAAHVDSWTVDPPLPTTILRYEDLLTDPIGQLRRVVNATGLKCDEAVLAHAVEVCAFSRLQRLEQDHGFELAPAPGIPFFRAGASGQGRSIPQIVRERLLAGADDVLARLGYT